MCCPSTSDAVNETDNDHTQHNEDGGVVAGAGTGGGGRRRVVAGAAAQTVEISAASISMAFDCAAQPKLLLDLRRNRCTKRWRKVALKRLKADHTHTRPKSVYNFGAKCV